MCHCSLPCLALPKLSGNRARTPVSLVDVFPTRLEIVGIPLEDIQTPLDGRSLLAGVTGQLPQVSVFAEHIDCGMAASRVCVRDGDRRLVYSRAYPAQLFDLSADPLEQNDLAETADQDMDRLIELAEHTWPLDALAHEVAASQTARKLIDSALAAGRQETWDFAPNQTKHNYVRRGDAFPEVERRGYLRYNDD